jgi:hypothetical protein
VTAPQVTADGLEFLVRRHLLGGYSYTQEEIDAGSESPEDRQSVSHRLVQQLRELGLEVADPPAEPHPGNWTPVD